MLIEWDRWIAVDVNMRTFRQPSYCSSMTLFKTTRRTLLKLIGGLAAFRGARSGTVDSFTLIPELSTGQLLQYRQDLKLMRDGVIAHRSRSTVTLEIRERVTEGWMARWITSGSEVIEADPRVRPILEAMHALWDGIAIDLVLDEGGRLTGLADFAAVREHGVKSLDSLVAMLAADPARAPLAEPLRAAMQATLVDGGMLAQSLLKEPAILLGAMGHDYGVGEPLEVRTRIPSPMGSGEVPVLGRYQVRGISSQEPRADIGWLMVLDRASMSRTLGSEVLGVVRQFETAKAASTGEEQEPVAASVVTDMTATIDFDDRGDFIVDTATAWPVSVRHVRRVSVGAGSRVDTVELTRLEA